MDGRMVSTAHRLGDLRIAECGQHSTQVGDQTPGQDDASMPPRAHQVSAIHSQVLTDHLDNCPQLDRRLGSPGTVLEQLLDEQGADLTVCDRPVRNGNEGGELVDRSFQLSDRGDTMTGERLAGCVAKP